eukprot:jgi/Ulvmu1/3707/UM170_0013.1
MHFADPGPKSLRPRRGCIRRKAAIIQQVQHTAHQPRCGAAAAGASPPAAAERPLPAGGSAAAAAPQVLAGKTVAVVGGGPGGMLCAAHLGAAVDVFERHDPAAVDRTKPPPALWNIALGEPAGNAIEAAGLSADFGPQWRYEGAASRVPGRPTLFLGYWTGQDSPLLASRIALATQPGIVAHLSAECERVYGAAVAVTHGMRAVGGNVCGGELVLEDTGGQRQERRFDMVVGADGAGSTVRRLMQEQDASMHVKIRESFSGLVCTNVHTPGHPSTHSALTTPTGDPFESVPEGFDGPLSGCAISFITPSKDAPAVIGSAAVNVRHGGDEVSFTISGDAQWLREARPQAEMLTALETAYPHLPQRWLEDMAEHVHNNALDEHPRIRCPTFITCSKMASGCAVILGDAAHSVSHNLGMGCNAALQDSEVLARACIAAGGDIAASARQYEEARLDNAHVLTRVSQRLDAISCFPYHKNILSAAAGFPYLLPHVLGLGSSYNVPGFLRPDFRVGPMFSTTQDWTQIERKIWWFTARLFVMAGLGVGLLSVLVWGAMSML